MIVGTVSQDGTPTIWISVANQQWCGVIDTGFNGDLELPHQLRSTLKARYVGHTRFLLGGGQTSTEDLFLVDFSF